MKISLRQVGTPPIRLKYQPGGTGPAGTIEVGTVTTGAAGSSASITNSGTNKAAVLNFTIPRGDTGSANTLTIGTVTTLSPGASATATVTGTAPNQTLSLGIPQGDQGPSGSVTDGDKGDIVVSSSGTVWSIDSSVMTTAGRALMDDANAAAQRATLGLVIGADVQAYDSDLAAIAALTTTSYGRGLLELASVSAHRTATGQKWATVTDQEVTGSAKTQFDDVALGSYSDFRISLRIAGNSGAAADFFIGWRGSTDGTTFPSSVSDYTYEVSQALGGTASAVTGTASSGFLTSLIDTANSPTIGCKANHEFFKGSATSRAEMVGGSFGYSTNWVRESQGSIYNTTAALTHIRIFASQTNGLGVGSRLIIEGC